ncbi:RNA 2',3'-cyclic phosphodiesterase [Thermocladium modestius]|uniref:RNA 2',3'-cyclic phosphodiesterase n=1 Tax=Thermocladium modestius TaxID=62609 RepID=A0A830GXG9_9CREN|nr:RNA 2',3'-cyclic phosphodiesterase [Thermocladium modestius]GGP22310.1 RNA 2',3'-cyclic phosphodiesterase [Thermocladium modestius]
MMRLFVAIDINNQTVRSKLKRFQEELESSGADLKLVELDNLHLTLRFIGEVKDSIVPTIANKLSTITGNGFRIHLTGTGAFPNMDYPRVVWVGMGEGSNEAAAFRDAVNEALSDIVGKDSDEFSPHITMARVKSGRNKAKLIQAINEWQEADFGWQDVNSIKLKKSTLTPRGPIYEDIYEVRLG